MKQSRFRQVDVFGQDPCTGNPVAVLLDAGSMNSEQMRQFSAWTNLSECTFVLPPTNPDADYRVRIFSLNTEYDFAGHPTLGTARAWLDAGGMPADPRRVVQECRAGLVPITINDGALSYLSPPRTRSGPLSAALLHEVIEILGVNPELVIDAEWVDNGPGWVGVLLDRAETVQQLKPDAGNHPGRWDIGVFAPQHADLATAFETRAFFTEGSTPLIEDPVTGSLNGAAAEWLLRAGHAQTPYSVAQGSMVGRNGLVHISQDHEGVWVGGNARTLVSGSVRL